MKKILFLIVSLFAFNCQHGFCQTQSLQENSSSNTVNEHKSAQTKFDLNFSGGTVIQLVQAIEKAMGKPINVIINNEDRNVEIPPLQMNGIYIYQLFNGLNHASSKQFSIALPHGAYSTFNGGYGFETADNGMADNTVWYFEVAKPTPTPKVLVEKVCRFYSLEPELKRGFTVDDITTAIKTGWKLAAINPTPELNYHKETKLLIAYGEPEQLKTIEDVLSVLEKSDFKLAPQQIDPATGLPVLNEKGGSATPSIDPATGLPSNAQP